MGGVVAAAPVPPLRRSCGCGGYGRPRHASVCARRRVFPPPSSPLRLSARLPPPSADGCAVGAQKAARPSRRAVCAPPVAACVRRAWAAAAVGRSAARSPLFFACRLLASPRGLPAAAPAPASVCAASQGGGACPPLRAAEAAAAPPPPPPRFVFGGGGCGFDVSAAAGLGIAPAAAGADTVPLHGGKKSAIL